MHDAVEIRHRIDRLLARLSRRDDYGELLANGHVVHQVEDTDAWRAAIRAQARADRIEVRTGDDGCAVYALLGRRPEDDTGDDEYMTALNKMAARAAALRHEPVFVARHCPEILISCDRCPALGYDNAEDHVIGGSLVDAGCPNEEEPQETSLSLVWARSSSDGCSPGGNPHRDGRGASVSARTRPGTPKAIQRSPRRRSGSLPKSVGRRRRIGA